MRRQPDRFQTCIIEEDINKSLNKASNDSIFNSKIIPLISLNVTLNEQMIWITKVDKKNRMKKTQ